MKNKTPETVLVLKSVKSNMASGHTDKFIYPESGEVIAPDWNKKAECGGGLHGWLWAIGDYSLKVQEAGAKWLVLEVDKDSIIELDGKVKFPKANVIHVGDFQSAFRMVWNKYSEVMSFEKTASGYSGHASASGNSGHASASGNYGHASASGDSGHASASGDSGHASASGDSGHASASGDSGHASASGNYGHASASGDSGHASASGNYGHASASGNYGHASASGNYGHASASGDSGHASASGNYGHASASGNYGAACVLGNKGKAKCSKNGSIILTYWDDKNERYRHVVGYAGEDGIKKDTWYEVVDGKLKEVSK